MRRVLLAFLIALPLSAQFEFFESRIRPALAAHCYSCHDEKTATSGLRLDRKTGMERGGSRGTALIAGNPEASLILRALSYKDPTLKMPPAGRLADTVIEDFREWIRHGAEDPRVESATLAPQAEIDWEKARRHWSFRPIQPTQPPTVKKAGWVRSAMDAFIFSRLETEGLAPAAPASKASLLRRVTFDLTGLPPTPDELESFLKDRSANPFEKVVDRLLQSPHFGERWARHWFDLVRFAETNGHEFDFYKYEAWRYRDYVIRAFNQDLPYDRFVMEHIAGDLLQAGAQRLSPDGNSRDTILGSGFLGLGEERNGATDLEEVRTEIRDSRIDVFGKTFLGLTLACARCHDHKFDPITTADYYGLGGIFDSTRTTLASIASPDVLRRTESLLSVQSQPPLPEVDSVELRPGDELAALEWFYRSGSAFARDVHGRLDSSRGVSDQLTGIMISRSFVPTKRYIHVRVAGTKFTPVREEPSLLAVTIFAPGRYPKGVAGNGDRTLRWKTITLKEEINQVCHLEIADRMRDGHLAVDAIVFSNLKEPPPAPAQSLPPLTGSQAAFPEEQFGRISYEDVSRNMRVHIRGSHHNLGPEVPRRFLEILDDHDPVTYQNGSGRLALARALTSSSNPLLARVFVNRAWKHLFGEGLVRTVDNFGRTGERPTHPELLDFIAREFMENGWSVKALLKRLLISSTYQTSSTVSREAAQSDPLNRLLSHMPARRLDAESIRDAILAVSGSLDRTVHGPSIRPHISPFQDGRGKPPSGPLDGNGRRSIYLEVRRNFLTPLLTAFDSPLPTTTVGRRSISTVPAQALSLMNNEFVAEQAGLWAKRIEQQYSDPRRRLEAMFVAAFARLPEPGERDRIETFLHDNGSWNELAHVLLNTKEFLFLQ